MKVKNKKEIIAIIKKYGLSLDNTYSKGSEEFLLICDAVTVNEFCFRNVRNIHFVGEVMWIDKTSIDVKDVHKIHISFTSIRYDEENIDIKAIEEDDFKIE